jgi:hypothetical protein
MKLNLVLISVALLAMPFQNCSKIEADDLGTVEGKAGAGRNVPQDMPASEADDDYDFNKVGCLMILESAIDMASTNDVRIAGESGNFSVEKARNLDVSGVSGSVFVKSAVSVQSFEGVSGNAIILAGKAGDIQGVSGKLCLGSATSVGKISGVSGMTVVAADSIESISGQSGTLHVYGATVGTFSNSSGNVCLHDGAKILKAFGNSGTIRNCR